MCSCSPKVWAVVKNWWFLARPAFQLDMDQRETVHQDRDIIAVVMFRPVFLGDGILVNDLQLVVVDVLFIDQHDVAAGAAVPLQHLDGIFLDLPGLFRDAFVFVGDAVLEKALPFRVGKCIVIQFGEFRPQVFKQVGLAVDRQVFISLLTELGDKGLFQFGLGLIGGGSVSSFGNIFRDDRGIRLFHNNIVFGHSSSVKSEIHILFHKWSDVIMQDAVPMLDKVISGYQVFRIVIFYLFKWPILPVFCFNAVHDCHCNLDIGIIEKIPVKNKITFKFTDPSHADFITF